jgi:preprotein translocase subunit Sec63
VFAYNHQSRPITVFPVYVNNTVIYGQPVNIHNLNSDYVELRTSKHIRGVRKVADFRAQQFHTSSKTTARRVYDPMKPFYDLLDIPLTASEDEVKKAYRQKARQHHPDADHSPDATTKMQAINEAYDKILKRFQLVK